MPIPASFVPDPKPPSGVPKSFVPDKPASLAPPALPSPQQMAARNFQDKPVDYGGLGTVEPMTDEQRKTIWNPEQGAADVAAGARNLASYRQGPGYLDRALEGGSQVMEGVGEIGKPAAVAAMATNPVTTAAAITASMAAQEGTRKALEAAGVSPNKTRFAANAVGALPIAGGAAKVVSGLRGKPKVSEFTKALKPSRSVAEQIVDEVTAKQEPLPPESLAQPAARPTAPLAPEPLAQPAAQATPKPKRSRRKKAQPEQQQAVPPSFVPDEAVPQPKPAVESKEVIQRPAAQPPRQADSVDRVSVGQQIRDAVKAADPTKPLSMKTLRRKFPQVPRAVIDQELRGMLQEGSAQGIHDTHPADYVRQNQPDALEVPGPDGKPQQMIGVSGRQGNPVDAVESAIASLESDRGNYVSIAELRKTLGQQGADNPDAMIRAALQSDQGQRLIGGAYNGPKDEAGAAAMGLNLSDTLPMDGDARLIWVARSREPLPLAEPQRAGERGSWSEKARQPGAPSEDKYLNFDRMGLQGEAAEQVLREQVRKFGDEKYGGEFKPTETHEAVRKAAQNVTPEQLRGLMESDMGIQNRATRDAIHTSLRTQAEEVTTMRKALDAERSALSPEDLAAREQALDLKTNELREMAGVWSDVGTSDARNLAMRRMVAAAVEQAINPGSKEAVHGWLDMVSALRKAGLLTGLKTHVRNVVGTGAFQVMEEASRIPASMVDIAFSVFGKRDRTITGPSLRGIMNASKQAATQGTREALSILRNGATERQLSSSNMSRELNFQGLGKASKIINTYVNTVFRTLGAEDQLARSFATRRSLEGQAKVMALNEARAGKLKQQDVVKRSQYLAENPTESMAAQAVGDAEIATFNNDNSLADGLSRFRGALGKPGQFTMDMIMPFTKTPTNVIARLLDYTPAGTAYKTTKVAAKAVADKSLSAEQQRQISQAMGRGAVGSALIYLGYKMAEAGYATGTRADDPGQANADEATGRSPGAIRFGDTWHRISAFSPLGNLITIGATAYRESSRDLKDESKRLGNYAAIATRTVMEQPMLQGTQQMVEALEKPTQKGEAFAAAQVGSFVPTFVSDVGTALDPKRRDQRGGDSTLGAVKNALASRLPGARESLPERYDVLGRPLEGRVSASVNPLLSNTARETSDPLDKEIVRLRLGISSTGQDKARAWKRGGNVVRDPETEDEFRLRSRARGLAMQTAMRRVIALPQYQGADIDRQKAALQKAMNRAQDLISDAVRAPRYRNADQAGRAAILDQLITRYSQ